jgi:hypothetical protein
MQMLAPSFARLLAELPPETAQAWLGGFLANIIGPLPQAHWERIAPHDQPGGGPQQDPANLIPGTAHLKPVPDTSNQFAVGARGEYVVILRPPNTWAALSKAEAINLAAWLAVLADPDGKEFARVIGEIKK